MKYCTYAILVFSLIFTRVFASIATEVNRTGPAIASSLPATIPTVFPFQFATDITVLDLGASGTGNDPAIVLTLNSDYTVTGGGYSSGAMQTGSVVVVSGGAHSVQAGDYIVILRAVPFTQTTAFSANGVLTATMIGNALDKGVTLSQQLSEQAGRSLRFEAGETFDGTLNRTLRAGKFLAFDANGAVTFTSTEPVYQPEYYDVRSYGAKVDGVTDDRAALIAACTAATNGTVYIPQGTLLISSPLPAFTNSPSMKGSSLGGSIVKIATGSTIATDILQWTSCAGVKISDLTFDANSAAVSSGYCSVLGFLLNTDFEVRNCVVKNYTVGGIGMNACSRGNIVKNYITRSAPANGNVQTQSILTTGAYGNCTDINIEDNVCIWAGIQLTQIRGNILGNYINGFKYGAGISTDADTTKSGYLSLLNNVITGGTGTDINGADCQGIENWSPYTKVSGNTCFLNSGNGIFNAGGYNTVTGNVCYNNGQTTGHGNSGISIYYYSATSASQRAACYGNTCFDTQGSPTQVYGVYVAASVTEAQIGPNNCWGNLTAQVSNNGTRTSSIAPVLEGSTSWTPGSILTLANTTKTLTVNGAALGDFVQASFSLDQGNTIMTGYVNTANSVVVLLYNPTGGTVTLGAGTLRVRVTKPTNYSNY